jgi:exodeoxyribonuclease VII small subunit
MNPQPTKNAQNPAGAPPTDASPTDASPTDASGPEDVAGLSFEAALAELEAIVKSLEGGQQKLSDAIAAYERGSALRRHCEAKLAEAESTVQAIVAADGRATGLRETS